MSRRTIFQRSAKQRGEADALLQRIGLAIHALRTERGLTQEALAKKAALSRSSIASIEAGRQNTTAKQVAGIASALGVAPVELLR